MIAIRSREKAREAARRIIQAGDPQLADVSNQLLTLTWKIVPVAKTNRHGERNGLRTTAKNGRSSSGSV